MVSPAIVWFRRDLRLADNPALAAAGAAGAPLIALYVLDEPAMGAWGPGGASRWWLHHSLDSLSRDLASRGVELTLRRGAADLALEHVIAQTNARAVYWNRVYEPWAMRRDEEIKARLRASGLRVESFNASLLFEPATLGKAHRVFTPFWRACLNAPAPATPLPAPGRLVAAEKVAGERLEDWRLLPTKHDWAEGFRESWRVGESAARERLREFVASGAANYGGATRDALGREGVSRLSPHLHFGEISPRQIWHAITASAARHFCANSVGASSAISCCSPIPICPSVRSTGASSDSLGEMTPRPYTHGNRARPAIRSSTRRCGSYGARATCTIARAWSRPPSW